MQLTDTPEVPLIVKLYASRVSFCHMVDQGQVKLEEAIRIWDIRICTKRECAAAER
jgi:hypothetical protein